MGLQRLKKAVHLASDRVRRLILELNPGLQLGRRVTFNGQPLISIANGSRIIIGDGVTINSRNDGYHVNMHSPCKLYADRDGALITIGGGSRIHGTCIHAYGSITIGRNCLIAANTQIMDSNGHDLSMDDVNNRINTGGGHAPVVIEDAVWIGTNSLILPGVRIGRGSVIGAGSIVTNDIPAMVFAAGNPARVLKDYSTAGLDESSVSAVLRLKEGHVLLPDETLTGPIEMHCS